MITPVPLEKQLVNVELAKGADERSRPELMAGITTLENLVCNQTGSWVKRDGCYLGPLEDGSGSGTYPIAVKKILPFISGWGCIADGGYLLHKQENQNTFRRRQQHMEFNAQSARYIGSSGTGAQDATLGMSILSVASCPTHDAYVSGANNNLLTLTVAERSTGAEYVYRIRDIPITGFASGISTGVQCVFVGGRYLQVFLQDSAYNLKLAGFYIDVMAAMPATEAAVSTGVVLVTIGVGTVSLQDAVGGTTYGYVLFLDGAGNTRMYQYGATLIQADSATFAGEIYTSMDLNETSGDVWMVQGGAAALYRAQSAASISTTTHAQFNSGKPGTYISCDTTTASVKIVYEVATTVGSTTLRTFQVLDYPSPYTAVNVVGSVYGWNVASRPFFMSAAGKHYIHLTKADPLNEITSNVICDISTFTPYSANYPASILFGSFRLACQLEPNFGLQRIGTGFVSNYYRVLRYRATDTGEFAAFTSIQTAARTAAVGVTRLVFADATAYGSCNFSGSLQLAHGGINSYDSRNITEQGFADYPFVNNVVTAGAGGLLNGSYRYYAVFRHVDANGAAAYSRVYGPVASVNVAGAATGKNTLTITQPGVTNRDAGVNYAPFIELYRTKSGGTQFYLCASSQKNISSVSTSPLVQTISFDPTSGLGTVLDNLPDTNLGSQATMYRQPGTPNGAVDRYAAPAASLVIQHKDRIFCVDPYGSRVFYSSFFVDGECPWFNPTFNFFVHAGSGPVTAMASMDGRLFIFKRDQVFVVDGDGPGEAGPTGNEFSPPQALASRYGCVDHRSVVVTPDGIMYRSTRGIELLTRNLKVQWIGAMVQNTVNANPYTTSCAMGPDARIYWTLAADKNNVNGLYYVPGCTIVYDTSVDAWSVHRLTGYTGILGHAKQGVAFVREPLRGVAGAMPSEVLVYADGYISVSMQDQVNSNDTAYFTPFTIETGWMKQGMLARQRVSDMMFLAKKRAGGNHAVNLSIAYDYSDTYTQTHTFQPNEVVSTVIEELNLQPGKQQVLAIRFKIQDLDPSDLATYPRGNGKGSDVLGIVAEVAPKIGGPKLSAAQKA